MTERSDLKIVVADDNKDAAMALTMLRTTSGFCRIILPVVTVQEN